MHKSVRLSAAPAPLPYPGIETERQSRSRPLLHRLTLAASPRWAALSLLLGTFALSLGLWSAFPLREDEAIYGFWALHWWHGDPWMVQVWPDKPPLFFWMLAPILEVLGPVPAAARWLNIGASLLTVAAVGSLARRCWGAHAGLAALALAGLNPFLLSFAATVYTDPLLVLWGTLTLAAALRRQTLWAGIFLGAAVMTKQQGLLYVPLILGTILLADPATRSPRGVMGPLLSLGSGAALLIGPILWWDSRRWQVAPSPWDLAVRHYGGLAPLSPAEWPARLQEWGSLLWYLTAAWPVWALVAGALLPALWPGARERPPWVPWIVLWMAGFVIFHMLVSFQSWDRYLLPLVPPLVLVTSYGLQRAAAFLNPGRFPALRAAVRPALLPMLLLLLLPGAVAGANGRLPLGGDHGHYTGLEEGMEWLQSHAPADAVLYHRQLGWHYRFYLFGRIGRDGFDLRWYPHTIYLADNAAKTPHRARYLVLPAWAGERSLHSALQRRGLLAQARFRSGAFTVYELIHRPVPACDWCQCRLAPSALGIPHTTPSAPDTPAPAWAADLCHGP